MEADDGMDNISLLKENGKSRVSSVEKTTCNVVSLVSHVIHDEIEDDVWDVKFVRCCFFNLENNAFLNMRDACGDDGHHRQAVPLVHHTVR